MRVYSASEAIGPAWEHTKALLWQDRRWGRLLKLCLLALGAELGTSFNFNVGGFRQGGNIPPTVAAMMAGFAMARAVFALLLFAVLLYLGSRLQLAQFDVLVLRDPVVAPAWDRHGRHTWRWAGLKVTILVGVMVVLLPLLIPALPIFYKFVTAMQPVSGPGRFPTLHWGPLLLAFAELFAIIIAALMLIRLVTALVLPGVAMEDLRFGAALRRGWELFRTDVPAMLVYALLQPVFLLMAGVILGTAMLLGLIVLALPFGLIGYLIWHAMHNSGGAATWVLLGMLGVVAVLIVGTVWLVMYVAVSGTLLMFARAWSLYFLGGRYPLLGQYLEPGPAVPVWTPPPSWPRSGAGGGPGFPVDPALA